MNAALSPLVLSLSTVVLVGATPAEVDAEVAETSEWKIFPVLGGDTDAGVDAIERGQRFFSGLASFGKEGTT